MPFDDDPVFEAVGFVKDGQLVDADGITDLALQRLEALADWSDWVPFAEALATAPRQPGVYLAREGVTGNVVYIGMAGERNGKGLRGRLAVYTAGKALASGLGEAVFDRALADGDWLRRRIEDLDAGHPARAKEWGRLAFARAELEVRWATTADKPSAAALERSCLDVMVASSLWNRLR